MKVIAAILLITFSSFSIERSILPSICMGSQQACKKKCSKESCCKKMAKMNHKPAKKTKGSATPQCSDCPLCVIIIDNPGNTDEDLAISKSLYAMLQVNDIADHSYQQWKPPNG